MFMFGVRLRALRKSLGLKQVELAQQAGIRPHTLWRIEAGRMMPSVDALTRIAEALSKLSGKRISVDALLRAEPSSRPPT